MYNVIMLIWSENFTVLEKLDVLGSQVHWLILVKLFCVIIRDIRGSLMSKWLQRRKLQSHIQMRIDVGVQPDSRKPEEKTCFL